MKNKKVVILHQEVTAESSTDEQDVIDQVMAVSAGLSLLGYEPIHVTFNLNLEKVSDCLAAIDPQFVFNLVESVEGDGQLIAAAPALLDHLRIPYTGSSTEAIFQTSNKLIAKEKLRAQGLPTPEWVSHARSEFLKGEPYIVKAIWEHASIGLGVESVLVPEDAKALHEKIFAQGRKMNAPHFAERYIPGREFNVAILGGEVLPIAEMKFLKTAGEPGAYQIVGYREKWVEASAEYQSTVPDFDFKSEDSLLLSELEAMTRACALLFELKGYARVDFRVDKLGRPWILEVNTNPCLTPGSGFHNATLRAGLAFPVALKKIIEDLNQEIDRLGQFHRF